MAGQIAPSYNPAPPQAPTNTSNVNLSPQATIQQILAAYQPAANQSTQNLNNSLAAAGVTGGGQVNAQSNLQQQLMSALAPSLAGAIQTSQGNQLQQSEFNAGAGNSQADYNIGNQVSSQFANTGSANSLQQLLLSLQNQDWLGQLGAFTGLNEAGLQGQQGINAGFANNFQIPNGGGLGNLGSALGGIGSGSSGGGASQPSQAPTGGNPLWGQS